MSTRLVTGVGKWTVLENFEALSSFTNRIFTISPPIDFSKDSMLALEMEIISGSGTSNRVFVSVNGVGSGYFTDGVTIKAGVKTIIDESGAFWEVVSSNVLVDIDDVVHVIMYFQLNQLNNKIKMQSFANGVNQTAHQVMSGGLDSSQTEINEIRVVPTSTSFKAGTRMTLYRIPR